jgi:RNA polymerase sigma factor (sigma-70 family)
VDEKQLILKCINGDAKSQRVFFDKYSQLLFNVSRRYTSSRETAEDVLQEAWLKIFGGLKNYQHKNKLEGWLKTIVIHTALRTNTKAYFKFELNGFDTLEEGESDPDVLSEMNYTSITQLIDQLPPGYAEVFKLAILDDYNHKEISVMMNIAESTSRVKLSEARKRMQKLILENDKFYCNAK